MNVKITETLLRILSAARTLGKAIYLQTTTMTANSSESLRASSVGDVATSSFPRPVLAYAFIAPKQKCGFCSGCEARSVLQAAARTQDTGVPLCGCATLVALRAQ